MSFIGLVTRKEKDTGATLIAKIVTPSKKKSAKKAFRVKVKANALDDYSCCVIDHATVKTRLENSQDLSQMVEDIVLSYNGVNGTTITYKINDKPGHFPKLTDYLSEDGKLLGRPKYTPGSTGNAEGTLTVIVSKGNSEVQSNIQISIKGISAEEVFSQVAFSKQKIWQVICGKNKPDYSDMYHTGGNNNIISPLTLVNEIRCDDISTVPIKLSYSISDDLIPYIPSNGEFEGDSNAFKDENGEVITSRIDQTSGKIITLPFAAAAHLCNSTTVQGSMITKDAMISERRVRIGGMHITVSMSLDDSIAPKTMILDGSVMSKKLTNNEVYNRIIEKNFKYLLNGTQMEFDNVNSVILTQAATGESTCTLKFMNHDICTTFEAPELGIYAGDLRTGISFKYSIRDTANQTYDATIATQAFDNYSDFNNGVTDDTNYYFPLIVNYTNMKTLPVDKHEFCVQCDISVSAFTVNGENNFGSGLYSVKVAKFKAAFSS